MRVRAPGARLGVWPALVLSGALLALLTQLLLAPHMHLPGWRLVAVSVVASLIGLVISKLYHKVLHPKESDRLLTTGLGIQGFVLGAVGSVAVGSVIAGLPLLRVLDAIVPGLLLAMTVGRFGCFFAGCCAGRPTAGRGLWSSDRRLGIRRVPVQLFEAGIAFTVGVGALLADVLRVPVHAGLVFVGALAAYTLGRQLLFPLRDIARQTRHGRSGIVALTVGVLVADVALALTL
jgi:phosphatidylglycerol:prolipoprotein diacylglycerol transferase